MEGCSHGGLRDNQPLMTDEEECNLRIAVYNGPIYQYRKKEGEGYELT